MSLGDRVPAIGDTVGHAIIVGDVDGKVFLVLAKSDLVINAENVGKDFSRFRESQL